MCHSHKKFKASIKSWVNLEINRTKLRQKGKDNFEKELFKLMNNAVFRKTMKNVRKDRSIKLAKTERKKNITKLFTEDLLAIEMRNTKILMNKPVYLGLSTLDY